jgi:hypothetical protein
MNRFFTLFLLIFSGLLLFAQNQGKSDSHASAQNIVIKLDGSVQNNWTKPDVDNTTTQSTQITDNESVSFSSTGDGIYINILKGKNQIKLFALTGQLLLNGDLSQGHFFIPARKGIYFLRINNKSYKVICK